MLLIISVLTKNGIKDIIRRCSLLFLLIVHCGLIKGFVV